ncbi:MAG: tetratricopeptide repeat protein [Flavobacteriales bacterium]|nr:tetratricopeptide repeat protein [Flavobacteriales bacterium]
MRFCVSVFAGIYFFILPTLATAQLNREELTSLWLDESRSYVVRLEALDNLVWDYYMFTQPDSAVHFANEMLKLAIENKEETFQSKAYNTLGVAYWNLGEFVLAIENYTRCMELDRKLGDLTGVSISMNNIALILTDQGLYTRAMEYYNQSLKIKESINDLPGKAKTLNNMGILMNDQGDFENAMNYHLRSLQIKKELRDTAGMAASLNNIGMVYAKKGDEINAMKYYNESLKIKKRLNDAKGSALTLTNMGHIYLEKNKFTEAENLYSESLGLSRKIGDRSASTDALIGLGLVYDQLGLTLKSIQTNQEAIVLAKEIGMVDLIQKAARGLYKAYEKNGDYKNALEMHELHLTMRDSLIGEESRKAVFKQQFKFEYEKKMLEDSLAFEKEKAVKDLIIAEKDARVQNQRIALFSSGVTLFLLIILAITVYQGKKRSDALLLNILPEHTAMELKTKGSSDAKVFENVTIIFTDFVDFTKLSEQLSPGQLVEELNDCFSEFDRIIKKHGLEKIKTIGDAYMAVCGLPIPNSDHAEKTIMAAIAILDYMDNRNAKHTTSKINIRIGVHSGSVVAGIVGLNKFQYDVWGDTVNIAARMESHGTIGKINTSEATFNMLKNNPAFKFTEKGITDVKGKGEMRMYWAEKA